MIIPGRLGCLRVALYSSISRGSADHTIVSCPSFASILVSAIPQVPAPSIPIFAIKPPLKEFLPGLTPGFPSLIRSTAFFRNRNICRIVYPVPVSHKQRHGLPERIILTGPRKQNDMGSDRTIVEDILGIGCRQPDAAVRRRSPHLVVIIRIQGEIVAFRVIRKRMEQNIPGNVRAPLPPGWPDQFMPSQFILQLVIPQRRGSFSLPAGAGKCFDCHLSAVYRDRVGRHVHADRPGRIFLVLPSPPAASGVRLCSRRELRLGLRPSLCGLEFRGLSLCGLGFHVLDQAGQILLRQDA